MLLKKIIIKNFKSYFGENTFNLSKGLTLIIGDNGDGKTSFFDALDWVLDTTNDKASDGWAASSKSNAIPSAKMLSLLEEGQSAEVAVTLCFDHDFHYVIRKSFNVTKVNGLIKTSTANDWQAYGEMKNGSRQPVDARLLINEIFDSTIQKFCLFRGESGLNVLDQKGALGELVKKLSDLSEFDRYKEIVDDVYGKTQRAFESELKSDKKTEKETEKLTADRTFWKNESARYEKQLAVAKKEFDDAAKIVASLSQNRAIYEEYNRLAAAEVQSQKEIKRLERDVNLDLDIYLLDRLWILRDFSPLIDELKEKATRLRKQKREAEREWDYQRAVEKGKEAALDKLVSILPWNVPDGSLLEQMIKDGRCGVCGRPVEKDSDAYNFMMAKLREFETQRKKEKENKKEEEALFKHHYIDDLFDLMTRFNGVGQMQLSNTVSEIPEVVRTLRVNQTRLTEERTKLEQTQKEISTLLQRNQISDRQNYFGFDQNLFIESSNSVAGKKQRIEDLQAQIDECTLKVADFDKKINALKSDESEAEHYRYIKDLMKVIQDTFAEGRELNANNLVVQLNDLANSYLRKLAAQDFHGTIALERKRDDTISIKLLDENNVEVVDPSGAQKTSLYMAVLFAIVELTNKKDENQNSYPLIFDAPTSSFSATREDTFYNIVNNLQQQCVILTKDLILPDGSLDEEKVRKMDCSIYRIRKAEGFNANNLASIQTEVLARKVIND